MNAIVQIEPNPLVPRTMDEAVRLAELMAKAKMVPQHLQGDIGTCLMVVEQALRWRMSPFAVAQCTSNIRGKLMWEGKLVAAAVESMGAIVGGFDYEFSGAGDDRRIVVKARRPDDANPRQITVRLGDVKTTNEWWVKQPDQQLVYSATRAWARRWTPSAILGVYAPEEFGKSADDFKGQTLEGEAVEAPGQVSQTVGTPAPARSGAAPETEAPPPSSPPETKAKPKISEWLGNLEIRFAAAQTTEDVEAIVTSHEVTQARDKLRNGWKDRLEALITEAYDRLQAAADDAAEAAVEDEMELPA